MSSLKSSNTEGKIMLLLLIDTVVENGNARDSWYSEDRKSPC